MDHINIHGIIFGLCIRINLVDLNAEIRTWGCWTGYTHVCVGKRHLGLCRVMQHSPWAGPLPDRQEALLPSGANCSLQEKAVQEKTSRAWAMPVAAPLLLLCSLLLQFELPSWLSCSPVFVFPSFSISKNLLGALCQEAEYSKLSPLC